MDFNYSFKQTVILEFSQDGYSALRNALQRYVNYVNRDTAKIECPDAFSFDQAVKVFKSIFPECVVLVMAV